MIALILGLLLIILGIGGQPVSAYELHLFLEADKTNEIQYTEEFKCHDFAVTLFESAEEAGLKVGFVSVYFGDYDYHALNVFDTEEGLVFVDCSGGHDSIVTLEVGKPYMTQHDNIVGTTLGGKSIVEWRIVWDLDDWATMWRE